MFHREYSRYGKSIQMESYSKFNLDNERGWQKVIQRYPYNQVQRKKQSCTVLVLSKDYDPIKNALNFIGFQVKKSFRSPKELDIILFTTTEYLRLVDITNRYDGNYDIVSLAFFVDCLSSITKSSELSDTGKYERHYEDLHEILTSNDEPAKSIRESIVIQNAKIKEKANIGLYLFYHFLWTN